MLARRDWQGRLILAMLVVGVLLRTWQYLGNPSLWIDELALSRNILERPLSTLLWSPLDSAQVAPPGFLLLVKAASGLLGNSEYALRLVPFLAGLVSLPLFFLLARRAVPASAQPAALALFALAPPLIRRTCEVHPYSTDVVAALALALFALRWLERPTSRRWRALCLAVAVAVWWSETAVFVGMGILAALAVARRFMLPRPALRALAPGAVLAGASITGAVLRAQLAITPEVRSYLRGYWNRWMIPWSPGEAIRWAIEKLPEPFRIELGIGPAAGLYVALLLLGWWVSLRKDWKTGLIIVAPVALTLLAAAAHRYPFGDRLVLFLVPSAFLGIAAGIDYLAHAAAPRLPFASAWIPGLLVLPTAVAFLIHRPVIRVEDARPAWRFIAEHRSPGEPVYVFFSGWLAASYYANRFGIPDRDLYYGRCHSHDIGGYRAELNALAGEGRVWLFFAHAPRTARTALVSYLDSSAVRLDSLFVPRHPANPEPGAIVFLYDASHMAPSADSMRPPNRTSACLSPGPNIPIVSAPASWGRSRPTR